jgi:hypothetical protein
MRQERRVADARLAVFVIGLIVAWLVFGQSLIHPLWLAAPLAAFTALVIWYRRLTKQRTRAERAVTFYEKGLARLDDRWQGQGMAGDEYRNHEHLYSEDLDLFGTSSLFELLCTARTRSGEKTLASWLLAPATPQQIRARQSAVTDLRTRLDLREELAILGADLSRGLDLEALAAWGEAPADMASRTVRIGLLVLSIGTFGSLLAWGFSSLSRDVFLLLALIEIGVVFAVRKRISRILAPVEQRSHELGLFAGLLARLEHEQFVDPYLQTLAAKLRVDGRPASRRVADLQRLVEWLNSQRNILFAPFAFILLWREQFSFLFEDWRITTGRSIGKWIAALGEIEALSSLATYSYEHPADPFPEIVEEAPRFEAEGLGHPLIPEGRCVRNDVTLGGDLRMLLVSGSNMSGKSTLLRSAGINAVLAQAGAPVRAQRLTLSPLAVGATLRIEDSIQAGRSRFFAEISRIREIVDLASGPLRVLFLLDEIFHGTNSDDRRRGAEAIVRGLIKRNAIGFVTTHDLALAQIVERLAPHAVNVHFEDQFEEGKMIFDYKMRPGIVQHSNALALMRAVGLEVEGDEV